MARYWLHVEGGIVVGALMAGVLPREEEAQLVGEWLLDGIAPVLRDLGEAPLRMNCPVPATSALQSNLFAAPVVSPLSRARDVNRRLVEAYFIHEGMYTESHPWPDVSDITADEARAAGDLVTAGDVAEQGPCLRTVTMVIEAHRAPLYLAYAIAARVRADETAIYEKAMARPQRAQLDEREVPF
jgi:hypothetical protein